MANDRLYQQPVEVVVGPTSGKGRLSQLPVEVVVGPTSGKGRLSQLPVEVVIQNVPGGGIFDAAIFDPNIFDTVLAAVTATVTVPLLDGGRALYTPTVVRLGLQSLTVPLLTATRTLYAPTLAIIGGTPTVFIPLLDSGRALYAPTVESVLRQVTLPVLTQTHSVFPPTLVLRTQALAIPLLTSTSAFYGPEVANRNVDVLLPLLDGVPGLYGLSVRLRTQQRYLSDSIPLSESISYLEPIPVASGSANVSSGLEPLRVVFTDTSSHNPTEWLWDFGDGSTSTEQHPTHIYAAGTWTVTLVATNATGDSVTYTFPVTISVATRAIPQHGVTPAVESHIFINAVDVTADVRIVDAMFQGQLNGNYGECQFAIRDLPHNYGFVVGHSIELYIEGRHYWSGFVTEIDRMYSFAVDDTTTPSKTERWFLIKGVDVNIFFSKRIVWNKVEPTKGQLPPPANRRDPKHAEEWAANTPSDVVVKYIISHYTDMLADGVNLDGILNIGSPEPNVGSAYTGAMTVGAFMRDTNILLSGLFYLTPDRRFIFRDIEVATNPYYLTDWPLSPDALLPPDDPDYYFDPYAIGPREYSATTDSAAMVNDAMVWGTAKGIDHIVFSRAQDAALGPPVSSQQMHGRWQSAEFGISMYKQESVDQRAHSIVYGNTQSQEGARWDRLVVQATVFKPLFMVGDVVECDFWTMQENVLWEPFYAPFGNGVGSGVLRATLPVRRMTITFPTKNNVRFDLVLSRELDQPWNIYEYFFPKVVLPDYKPPPHEPFPPIDGGIGQPPQPEGCSDAVCGITDGFGRTAGPAAWGISDSGYQWEVATSLNTTASVAPGLATLHALPGSANSDVTATLRYIPIGGTFSMRLKVRLATAGHSGGSTGLFQIDLRDEGSSSFYSLQIEPSGLMSLFDSLFEIGTAVTPWALNTDSGWFYLRWEAVANTVQRLKVWPVSASEPTAWDITRSLGTIAFSGSTKMQVMVDHQSASFSGESQLWLAEIDIADVNRCSSNVFDDFSRTTGSGWGVSSGDGGYLWQTFVSSSTQTFVANGAGQMQYTSTQAAQDKYVEGAGPWDGNHTAILRFKVDGVDTTDVATLGVQYIDGLGGSGGQIRIEISSVNGRIAFGGVVSGAIVAKTDWVANQYYVLKIERQLAGKTLKVKIWPSGTAEPSTWTAEATGWSATDPLGNGRFWIQWIRGRSGTLNNGPSRIVAIDSITFDYAGKSCYMNCGPADLDSFDNRTIPPSSGSPAGWGTASSGAAWSTSTSGGVAWSVSGGSGRFVIPPTSGVSIVAGMQIAPGTMSWPMELHQRVKTDVAATALPASPSGLTNNEMFRMGMGNASSVRLDIEARHTRKPGAVYGSDILITSEQFGVLGSATGTIPMILPGVWYEMKVRWSPNENIRWKWWVSSDPEPDWNDSGRTFDFFTGDHFYFDTGHFAGISGLADWTVSGTYEYDFIKALACTGVSPDAAGSYTASFEPLCQEPKRIDVYRFQLTQQYKPGSSDVHVNGLAQRRGLDYIESPSDGKIQFAFPVASTAAVWVCFMPNGAI